MGSIFLGSLLVLLAVLFSPASIKADHVGPLVADSAEPIEAHKFSFQMIPSLFIKQGFSIKTEGLNIVPAEIGDINC